MQPLDANNANFYNWLVTLCAYIQRAYGIMFFPTWTVIAEPGINSNNPSQVVAFYLTSPMYSAPMPLGQAFQAIFGDNFSLVAAIVLNTLSYPKPAPQPISVTPVVVAPPAPANPVGASFQDMGETDFTDLGSPNLPVGGTFTDPSGRVFVKMGRQTPFGLSTWFVEKKGN